jgi:hypothetical protein
MTAKASGFLSEFHTKNSEELEVQHELSKIRKIVRQIKDKRGKRMNVIPC